MESLRVKKQPLPVTLYLIDGTVESGTVFLPATSPRHTGSATIAELMDESDHLLRFKFQGDRFQLVGKAGIATIKTVAAPHAEGFYETTAATSRWWVATPSTDHCWWRPERRPHL